MNKQQRKILKLTKIFHQLQLLNNPRYDGDYDKYYKKCKWLYRNISDKEYTETMEWCKYVLAKSK